MQGGFRIWGIFANRLIFPESDAAVSGRWSSVFRVAVEKRLGLGVPKLLFVFRVSSCLLEKGSRDI